VMIEMLVRLMSVALKMIDDELMKIRVAHSFDLESLRITFCRFSLLILSDLEISHRNNHV
jgi:hypothetical protein